MQKHSANSYSAGWRIVWAGRTLKMMETKNGKKWKSRKEKFETLSGIEIKQSYGPENTALYQTMMQTGLQYAANAWKTLNEKIFGHPGISPYRRSIYESMYRGQLPTVRQFCGYGTPQMTNERLHELIAGGQKGLSIAYDQPTLHGRDANNENWSYGYVGKDGVSITSLADFENLFANISLKDFSVSQTINFPSIVFFAMFLALAKKQGIPFKGLKGTMQADMRKEAISQKEYWFPMKHSMRLEGDMMEYCIKNLGHSFYPQNASGYHMGEDGASPLQELAFTLKNGLTFVDYCVERGMPIDEVAARTSAFWNCKGFWEDITKMRASRVVWYEELIKRGAKTDRAQQLKFHVQNSGASYQLQQPLNNIIRGTLQCLATMLGGAQSIHINSFDEVIALPSTMAALVSLDTQHIVGGEMHITDTVDPLGGSYFVENLTDQMINGTYEYFKKIDSLGGMLRAIEIGYPQSEVQKTALEEMRRFESGELVVVGVNKHINETAEKLQKKLSPQLLRIPTKEVHEEQCKRIAKVKQGRDENKVTLALKRVSYEARGTTNLVKPILEAVEAYATVEEIMFGALAPVFGRWRAPGD
jgi:methylmalonyl-CoA mutase, N-terminal domain